MDHLSVNEAARKLGLSVSWLNKARILAKKRAIKQGAMQDLLTGHRRLPGFEGERPRVSLGALYDFKNGLNKGKEYFGVGIPIVNYMDVFRSQALSMAALHGRVTVTPDEIRAYGAQRGDVFFTRTSETQEEIGMTSVMLDQPSDCVFSGFLLRARPKTAAVVRQYARYCFRPYAVRQQIIARSSYTTRALTNGRALSMVELDLPEPHEQHAIAAVLSDIDAEIAAVEEKLAKARAVKQGMMQVLLTGEIRLV